MSNASKALITIIAAALLCLMAMAYLTRAHAHSWYTTKRDPIYGTSCCGGSECARIILPREWVLPDPDGYRVVMTIEQTRTINPNSLEPVNEVIPWSRVQPSEDGNWHACIFMSGAPLPRGRIICFFAPPNS